MSDTSRHITAASSVARLRRTSHPAKAAPRLAMLLMFAAAPARADSPFEGCYQGRGEGWLEHLQVFKLGDGSGSHFVVAGTAIPNAYTGEQRGLAKPSGAGALLLTRRESGSEETCTLTLMRAASLYGEGVPVRKIDWKFVF